VRAGLHWGTVLTDGAEVTGDAVNICARVADQAVGAHIFVTSAAFDELPNELRVRCHIVPATHLKGVVRQIQLVELQWRVPGRYPAYVHLLETGERIPLPTDKDLIRFGRLKDSGGRPANDVVLALPDPTETRAISRWHFELRRLPEGFSVRNLSRQPLEVDDLTLETGENTRVQPGTRIDVAGVLTVVFSDPPPESTDLGSTLKKL
jgi:hypothetical protein